jgi:hypothetical protein
MEIKATENQEVNIVTSKLLYLITKVKNDNDCYIAKVENINRLKRFYR